MQSSPPGPGRRERKRLATRDALIEAAAELFLRDGFARTTVSRIAEAADVAPRTFFLHFASKQDVLFHHVEDYTDRAVRAVARLPEGATPWEAVQQGLGVLIDQFAAGNRVDALAPVRAGLVGGGAGLPASLARRLLTLHSGVLGAIRERFPDADPDRCSAHLGAAIGAVAAAGLATAAAGSGAGRAPVETMHDALARAGRGFDDRHPV